MVTEIVNTPGVSDTNLSVDTVQVQNNDAEQSISIADNALNVTNVNSGWPSSGNRWRFLPLIAAANSSSRLDASPPSRSPLSRHGPRRRDGSPSGDVSAPPALSLRGCGATALNWPPSAGRRREVSFQSLVTPVADEGEFTNVVLRWSKWSVPNCVRPLDVARGLAWDPLTLAWDRSSLPSRYLIDWGVCPETYSNRDESHRPTH